MLMKFHDDEDEVYILVKITFTFIVMDVDNIVTAGYTIYAFSQALCYQHLPELPFHFSEVDVLGTIRSLTNHPLILPTSFLGFDIPKYWS